MPSPRRLIVPLALATMATQASIVVLAPIVVEIGRDLEASVSAIGQGRALLAGTAVVASFAIGSAIDRLGVRPVLLWGASLALAGALATALAPSLLVFYLAHVVVGLGVACLLSAGFAGVAAYFDDRQAWAMSYVVGSQSIAWIAGTPTIGLLTDTASWRLAYAVPAVASLLALGACAALLPRSEPSPESSHAWARPAGAPGLIAVLRNASARRWAIAELVAYSAWTAELTYAGAFYVQSYGIEETLVGLLLAIGSVAFLAATGLAGWLAGRVRRRPVIIVGALGMGALLVPVLNVAPAVWFTLALFCVMAVFAGLRTTTSSTLGLSQLPARPGSMMAARTASAQLGYMVGAVVGGAVLALADFGVLGFVLFAGMLGSALLYMRVSDPLDELADRRLETRRPVVPVAVD
jgi:predicted MFS family arabinose efflux permease